MKLFLVGEYHSINKHDNEVFLRSTDGDNKVFKLKGKFIKYETTPTGIIYIYTTHGIHQFIPLNYPDKIHWIHDVMVGYPPLKVIYNRIITYINNIL